MQDLLNEEEFIEKKSDYNPWRRFGVFYGIAAAIILTYFVYIKITGTEVNDNILMIIILGIPALLTFLMVFTKKGNYHLSWKLILLGVEGLMATCYITLFSISVVNGETYIFTWEDIKIIFFILAIFMGLGLICFALIYPILRYKRKRLKQRL